MSQSKRILFIGRQDDRASYDTSWSMAAQMKQYATSDITYEACHIEDLVFTYDGDTLAIYDGKTNTSVGDYDGIFLLGWFKMSMHEDMVMSLARFADMHGIPLLNPEALYLRSRSKLSQYVVAALHDVHITEFVVASHLAYVQAAVKKIGLAYPMIVKAVNASRGQHNYLVEDAEELAAIYQANPERVFVVQRFIPNDGDYRLLVMGDKVSLAIHRQSQTESHLNNTSQGGVATVVDLEKLDAAMLEESVKIAQLLRRSVTGVDMIVDKETGEHYMLEANNMPQISTGSMVGQKMLALDTYLNEWLAR